MLPQSLAIVIFHSDHGLLKYLVCFPHQAGISTVDSADIVKLSRCKSVHDIQQMSSCMNYDVNEKFRSFKIERKHGAAQGICWHGIRHSRHSRNLWGQELVGFEDAFTKRDKVVEFEIDANSMIEFWDLEWAGMKNQESPLWTAAISIMWELWHPAWLTS